MTIGKTAWLVYDRSRFSKASGYYQLYFKYLEEYGIKVELYFADEIEPLNIKELPDIAIMRTYSLNITKYLENKGVKVYNNSRLAEYGNNKYLAYELAKSLDIQIPVTKIIQKADNIIIDYPVVVKSLFGHGGSEVFWADSFAEYEKVKENIADEEFLIQKPVSESGKDLRVYVVGNRIVAAMLRQNPHDFRSNYSLGGAASLYTLDTKETQIVNKIISQFDIGMAGIDFMFDKDKLIFNEIEDVVGARMLYANTDIDIVKLYAEHIYNTSK